MHGCLSEISPSIAMKLSSKQLEYKYYKLRRHRYLKGLVTLLYVRKCAFRNNYVLTPASRSKPIGVFDFKGSFVI